MLNHRDAHICGLVSFTLLAALYIWTASPNLYWLDSSEFSAAAFSLGTPHPPGHPLYTASTHPLSMVPLGSIGWRMGLASALCTAAAGGLLAWIASVFLRITSPSLSTTTRSVLSISGALLAGTAYALWFQAVRSEVYALHLLIASAMTCGALILNEQARASRESDPDARLLFGIAFLSGLGIANHHYLTLFVGLPIAILFATRSKLRNLLLSAKGLIAVGFGVLGTSIYALVPIRSLRDPLVNWGDVSSLQDFWWLITAQAFQKSLERAQDVDTTLLLVDLFGLIARWITPIGLVFAFAAFAGLTIRRHTTTLAVLLTTLLLSNLATQSLLNFDPFNPDVHGYFALSAWILSLSITLGLGLLLHLSSEAVQDRPSLKPILHGAFSAVLVGLVAVNFTLSLPESRLDTFRDPDIVNASILQSIPTDQDALVFTSNYKTLFNLWHAQAVEDQRPDVTFIHRNFLANEPYIRQLKRRHPDLLPLAFKPSASNRLNLQTLLPYAKKRPVFIEYDVNIQPDLIPHLIPHGLLFRVSPQPLPKGDAPNDIATHHTQLWNTLTTHINHRAQHTPLRPDEPGSLELETERFLLWQHYLQASAFIHMERTKLAGFHISNALKLNPKAPELVPLINKHQALLKNAPNP